MRIGLDFDNTIVCYDEAVTLLAEERFDIPKQIPRTKSGLRKFLVKEGREQEWTAFQGVLYGPGMRFAKTFKGTISTMEHLVHQGHELVIISHRSRRPYAGEPHDLHKAAKEWVKRELVSRGLFARKDSIVEFLETREAKIARISELGCQAFVDDLPEVLEAPDFPTQTIRILFDTSGSRRTLTDVYRIRRWAELKKVFAE